ncbi:autophagy-related protein 27-domain-containing protein [Ganoderma leucocontextum]|nr:autophagy-related protein 27-domain-containing protein [Ganoderma leucocontextum]
MYAHLLELVLGLLVLGPVDGRTARTVTSTSASLDPPPPVWLGSLAKRCSFKLGETSYDLCPIVEGNEGGWTVQFKSSTPPTVTKTSYRIDLRKPLERDANVPEEEQCPDGTWICQTISNRRPRHDSEDPRVLQVVPVAGAMHLPNITHYRPGVNATAQLTPARENPNGRVLHVRLHGGHYMYGPQKADFQFLCDRSVGEPSTPTYAWSWNGTHTFQWRTKHACGTQRAVPPPADKDKEPLPPVGDEDQDVPPPDDESDGQELRGGHPFSDRATRMRMILLLSSFTALATIAYVAWRPPARMRHYVSRFVKAHPRLARFRVGERVLVRWAYEDMEMEEAYAPGEEDTMVNWGAGEIGEGIPLKPSPRKGHWANYGTT